MARLTEPPPALHATQPLRILVIDDDPDSRGAVCSVLRVANHDVTEADDGTTGLERVRENRPDLIICDVAMPGLSGYDVLRALKRDVATAVIPFIFLSGNSRPGDIREGMGLGADDYLSKPYLPAQLFDSIGARIERQRAIAQRLEEMRVSVAHSVPTELFTPLNAVLGFSMLLLDSLARGEEIAAAELKDSLESIHGAGEDLMRIASNYALFAQLIAGDNAEIAPAVSEPVDWEPALAQAVRRAAQRHHRTADLHYSFAPARLAIGQTHLEKIVLELLENAFKYSRPGQWVAATGAVSAQGYILRVADHGRGMSQEQLETVSARLHYERPHRVQPSLGLGLHICRLLAQRHGATITLTRNDSAGITAEARIPLLAD